MSERMRRLIQGPEGHPLRDLSVVWREDGGVQLTIRERIPIEIRDVNLRKRGGTYVRINPGRETPQ
jgi:hypothetical protein